MKKILIACLLFSSIFAKASVESIRAEQSACLDEATSNVGMKQCVGDAYDKADAELNTVYKEIVKKLKAKSQDEDSAEILKRLVAAERAWITFRDTNCDLQSIEMLNGTGEGLINAGCVTEATLNRIVELQKLLGQDY